MLFFNQQGTIMGYYGKEIAPKGVKASDMTNQKMVKVSKVDKEEFHSGTSGEKVPMKAMAAEIKNERKMPIAGGVGQGKADGIGERHSSHMGQCDGNLGEMKGGAKESVVYAHERKEYAEK